MATRKQVKKLRREATQFVQNLPTSVGSYWDQEKKAAFSKAVIKILGQDTKPVPEEPELRRLVLHFPLPGRGGKDYGVLVVEEPQIAQADAWVRLTIGAVVWLEPHNYPQWWGLAEVEVSGYKQVTWNPII